MLRPCFLVIDREHPANISSRKLVIETAKFNVITAYSGAEAVEALLKFPNVDGVVMDAGMRDIPCTELIQQLRQRRSDLRIVVVGNSARHDCHGATHRLENFDPREILLVLQQMHPAETAVIMRHEQELSESDG